MLHIYTTLWMFSSSSTTNNFLTVLPCKLVLLYVYLFFDTVCLTSSRDAFIPTIIRLGYDWFGVFTLDYIMFS
jgi:hypothetical protein